MMEAGRNTLYYCCFPVAGYGRQAFRPFLAALASQLEAPTVIKQVNFDRMPGHCVVTLDCAKSYEHLLNHGLTVNGGTVKVGCFFGDDAVRVHVIGCPFILEDELAADDTLLGS